jgi:ERF superfamily
MTPDTDIDMDAAISWTASEPSDAIIPAFVEALWDMEDVVKRNMVSAGPMKYSYADLGDVLAEARPNLREHGLALVQVATVDFGVSTTLLHTSGQWMRFAPLRINPAGGTPQHVGSAITYARRYAILSILGLATEDDDGRAASVEPTPHVENPLTPRIDAALQRMMLLSDEAKLEMREWADAEGRKLSGKAMLDDTEWLGQIESWLDINEDEDGEPETSF